MNRHLLLAVGLVSLVLVQPANSQTGRPVTAAPNRNATPPKAEKAITMTYSVADLVTMAAHDALPPLGEKTKKGTATSECLCDLICSVISPKSWQKAGGAGTIQYFAKDMALVVSQTPDVQEEIFELLRALRRLHDVQVVLEFHVVSVADATWEKASTAPHNQLMKSLQEDKRTETLQAPRMTLFNGQTATLSVTDDHFFLTGVSLQSVGEQSFFVPQNEKKEVGFKATVQVAVSADRRHVSIDLKAKQIQLASSEIPLIPVQIPIPQLIDAPDGQGSVAGKPTIFQMYLQQPKFSTQNVEQKFHVPDGGTSLIVAGKENRTVRKVNASLASLFPFGDELFGNVSYVKESRTVLFFVTPRIIIKEEIEGEILGEKQESPQTVREAELTLPSPHYLNHPPAYIPPSPVYPLPRELKSLVAAGKESNGAPSNKEKSIRRVAAEELAEANAREEKPAAISDSQRIQGVWQLVHSLSGRNMSKAEGDVYFMVDGKRARFQTAEGDIDGGLYVDANRKTKTFDFATSGWTREGIYILDGDVLMMCYDLKSEAQRPSDFTVDRDSQRVLFVFKRIGHSAQHRRADGSRTFPMLIAQPPAAVQPPPTAAP